ncbi:glycosyltransferase [Paenibacillus popilliae]|uniref:Glycosyltransferase n=1 Tax=Paenibacillus popilliae ATCC 14706 TaxID=1212764 RepID=M9LGC7_PAEPP|nr:glycosyltransferase [Paenibacillus popilliae]GAC41575.1 glycosyltransferase [Paenibacillus popilliae ATCC 14706]
MSKTGIFLGFQPGTKLTAEGIGRLLAFILKENGKDNESIIILCPFWLKDPINDLLKDNKIPTDKFEILSTGNVPIGVKIKEWIKSKKSKKRKKPGHKIVQKLIQQVIGLLRTSITEFLSTSSWYLITIKLFLYLALLLVLSPLLLCLIMLYYIYFVIRLVANAVKNIVTKTPSIESLKNIKLLVVSKWQGKIYQSVLENELSRLVKKVNAREDIGVCLIPSMIWPQIKDLKAKKILAAPDIVFYDFPTQFPGVSGTHSRIRQCIDVADHLICYSEAVKTHHLVNKCGVDPEKITVIQHANVDMRGHLKVSNSVEKYFSITQNAQQIVRRYVRAYLSPGHVLYNSDLAKMDCIIYSSQYRPHKNIFNLIKAMKILNKNYYKNAKLILTGDISASVDIQNYINLHSLQHDVIVMPGLPSEVLAAVNKLAKCAVNPTLFEGGFPFTFSEAYSVGTPSVMSSIPVVESEISIPHLKEIMLFDPYDPSSIADRIAFALDNFDELFKAQAKLYEKFSRRDWSIVVGEYNRIFCKYK